MIIVDNTRYWRSTNGIGVTSGRRLRQVFQSRLNKLCYCHDIEEATESGKENAQT